MKKIVYLLLLGLASCQQDDIITEVPKDDWSVIANTAGQIKGQVNIKFKELPEDLQIVTTRSGVDTDNGQLNFVIRQLGGTRLERVFPHAGKFEARTREGRPSSVVSGVFRREYPYGRGNEGTVRTA